MYIERATSQILYKFFVFHRQASPWRRCKKKKRKRKIRTNYFSRLRVLFVISLNLNLHFQLILFVLKQGNL